jgi:hypothetical protein
MANSHCSAEFTSYFMSWFRRKQWLSHPTYIIPGNIPTDDHEAKKQ